MSATQQKLSSADFMKSDGGFDLEKFERYGAMKIASFDEQLKTLEKMLAIIKEKIYGAQSRIHPTNQTI